MSKFICVEKSLVSYLTEAVQYVKNNPGKVALSGVGGVASGATSAITQYLIKQNIPHKVVDNSSQVPADHSYHQAK